MKRDRRPWTAAELTELRNLAPCNIGLREASERLGRSEESIRGACRRNGIKWRQGCWVWTPEKTSQLYYLAGTMTKGEAAAVLGCTREAVSKKTAHLGIKWHQGAVSANGIARSCCCSPTTVRRLIDILYPDARVGAGAGARFALTEEQAERVKRVLRGNLKNRERLVRAGKAAAKARRENG